jgi:hypothetical protein
VITLGIYPIILFDNYAKLIIFTLIPAEPLAGAVHLPAGTEVLRI